MNRWRLSALVLACCLMLTGLVGCASRQSVPATSASKAASSSESITTSAPEPCEENDLELRKPVIYLYPPRRTDVRVRLSVDGVVTKSDPRLDTDGMWLVQAEPTGALTDRASGRRCPYLFWEAETSGSFDMSSGFIVSGRDTEHFLESKLAFLGLSDSEAAAFMEYWLPLMEDNRYNLIRFEGPAYEKTARLTVSPEPDMQIRVFMVYRPLDSPVQVRPQELVSPGPRRGFVLVEWGGTALDSR